MRNQTGAGGCEAHLRVANVLVSDATASGSGGGGKKGCRRVLRRLSPRRALSRWLSFGRQPKRETAGRDKGKRRVEGEAEGGGDGLAQVRCSTKVLNDAAMPASSSEDSGGAPETIKDSAQSKDSFFNIGVGFGLVFLAAAGKNELNKMIELRSEMEHLLRSMKEEFCQNETNSNKRVRLWGNISHTPIEESEGLHSNGFSLQHHKPSHFHPSVLHDHSLKRDTSIKENCSKGIDQLEAELEAELECLELRLALDNLSEELQQQSTEVSIEDTAPRESLSTTFGDQGELPEAGSRMHCGVHPKELERRLHEVVESRQQDKIKELEAALEYANQKILEKEMEASWWKDRAQLIYQFDPIKSISHHFSEGSYFFTPELECREAFGSKQSRQAMLH